MQKLQEMQNVIFVNTNFKNWTSQFTTEFLQRILKSCKNYGHRPGHDNICKL